MSTPKSVRERMLRQTRPDTVKPRGRSMAGRVAPKKTGNNDPTRGSNVTLNQQVAPPTHIENSVINISKLLVLEGSERETALRAVEDRMTLKNIINHLLAVRLGGWKKDGEYYINESSYRVSNKRWKLVDGGKLIVRESGNQLTFNIDRLYDLKRLVENGESAE